MPAYMNIMWLCEF